MRRVIIETPYRARTHAIRRRNRLYTIAAVRDCVKRGETPYASHLIFPGALNDNNPGERLLGIRAGYIWWEGAEAIIFYIDHGFSPGMCAAQERAVRLKLPFEERTLVEARNSADETGGLIL
jgi:hypothetical protein